MAARGSVTSQDIVRAAIALADAQGIEHVTLRSLGSAIGMHHTAIYRHFSGLDELMGAIFEMLVDDALQAAEPVNPDPVERLMDLSRAMRATLRDHPTLVGAIVKSGGPLPKSIHFVRMGVAALADMGLTGEDLVVWFQQIETHTVGSAVFDFAGAPHHLEGRRQRYRLLESPAHDAIAANTESIDRVNEAAFERTLRLLVLAAAASGSSATPVDS